MENRNGSYSQFKVFHHHDRLDMLDAGERCAPIYIRIKPTNACNHNCYYCTYAAGNSVNRGSVNRADSIPWPKLREIIRDMADMGVKAVTFSGGGEPLTYSHIREAAEMVCEAGIDYSLISNGQLLKGETARAFVRAKWVRVSLDSSDGDLDCKMRGLTWGAFDDVCANLEEFSKIKAANCVLGINYVVGNENYHLVYQAAKLVKELGADNIKFSALAGAEDDKRDSKAAIRAIQHAKEDFEDEHFKIVSNYEQELTEEFLSERQFDYCYTKELVTVIAADQKVYLCHQRAYDPRAVLGDLKNASFKEVWFAPETIVRAKALRPRCDCKNPCVYEERNILLENYFSKDRNHINFI